MHFHFHLTCQRTQGEQCKQRGWSTVRLGGTRMKGWQPGMAGHSLAWPDMAWPVRGLPRIYFGLLLARPFSISISPFGPEHSHPFAIELFFNVQQFCAFYHTHTHTRRTAVQQFSRHQLNINFNSQIYFAHLTIYSNLFNISGTK